LHSGKNVLSVANNDSGLTSGSVAAGLNGASNRRGWGLLENE